MLIGANTTGEGGCETTARFVQAVSGAPIKHILKKVFLSEIPKK